MIMHIKVFCESATIEEYDDILENVKHLSFPHTYLKNKDFSPKNYFSEKKTQQLPPGKITLWSAEGCVIKRVSSGT